MPEADVAWTLPGQVVFAGEFFAWSSSGCGAAMYVPDVPGPSLGRGWLVSRGQFMDIVAQENGGEAGDVDDLVGAVFDSGATRAVVGSGAYGLMLRCGSRDGVPAWTFTSPLPAGELVLNAPSAAYLAVLAAGVAETTGVSVEQAEEYLRALPGFS